MATQSDSNKMADASQNRVTFDKSYIGCVIDGSCSSADYINKRTIEFAEEYGFKGGLFAGYFDGTRGQLIEMTLDDAEGASHQGECDEDVAALLEQPEISAQFDAMNADDIRAGLKEYGAWTPEELADDHANRLRALWSAACDIRENADEQLSETADEALAFLNEQDCLPYCSWYFDDNSLFYSPDVDSAREDVGFVSVKSLAAARRMGVETDEEDSSYPPADYEGEWLHVSDHDNATLYVREGGKDTEVWGVV